MKVTGSIAPYRYVRYPETVSEIEGFHFRCEGRQGQDLLVYGLVGRSISWLKEIKLGIYITHWNSDAFSLEIDDDTISELEEWRWRIFEEFSSQIENRVISNHQKLKKLRGEERIALANEYINRHKEHDSRAWPTRHYSPLAKAIDEWFFDPFLPDNFF